MLKELLDFEKPLIEIEEKIEKLRSYVQMEDPRIYSEIEKLTKRSQSILDRIYSKLTPWQKTQVARHSSRPTTQDFIELIIENFVELHGDRHFADDPSIIGGMGRFNGKSVIVIGHQKGKGTKDKIFRNFGMPNPEGYRKSLRLMQLASKFRKPILTFIDTPGAYPGIGAEERGQSEAISKNLFEMFRLEVPIIASIIGEGGSGGALAIGVGDRVIMLEHSIYSVISPEGCAAILWGDGTRAADASETLKMTAQDLKKLGVIDTIVKEPVGGAHRNPTIAAQNLKETISKSLKEIESIPGDKLTIMRYEKFRKMGVFKE
ncbi:MAG: acetyl-CoA carboxylase carboxyltransferase subunit alpha [Nitrospirae bacterium RIFCSPLOWO2_02_42_7]|nr:MAG: acetyl-CoA carboxylase carboxyltransferase subunit alpha [Nitrospirae bacterium RIFCSPLOWO2_02_42_7]